MEREQGRQRWQGEAEARLGALEAALEGSQQQGRQAREVQQTQAEAMMALRHQLQAARRQADANGEETQRAFGALKANFASNAKLLRQSLMQQQKQFQQTLGSLTPRVVSFSVEAHV